MLKLSVMGSGVSQGFTDVCACDAVKRTCSSGGCGGGDNNRMMPGGGGPVIDWGDDGWAGTPNGGPIGACMQQMWHACLLDWDCFWYCWSNGEACNQYFYEVCKRVSKIT